MTLQSNFTTERIQTTPSVQKRPYGLTVALCVVAIIGLSWCGVKANEAVNDWQLQREKQAHLDAIAEAQTSADLFRQQIEIAEKGIASAKANWTYHNSEIQRINGEMGKQ